MKRLPYNLSPLRTYHRGYLFSAIILLLLLTAGLTVAGIGILSESDPRISGPKKNLQILKQKISDLESEARQNETMITLKKKSWSKAITLANSLIQNKNFSFVSQLNFLEEVIPEGVYLSSIFLGLNQGPKITFSVRCVSLDHLIRLYKKLSPHHLEISNESEVNGIFHATLAIILKQ